ncbi:hypothetical protein [Pantoea stewartii]|uniref:hypothetical protein n=1 Tax=Pantoea stewartii TaxID=66269 RepID=UPI00345C2521
MRELIFGVVVFLSVSSLSLFASDDFTGQWSGKKRRWGIIFDIELKQNDKLITGSNCYITRNGREIDCPEGNESNLDGAINGRHALVEFNSSFGGVNGKADLELKDGNVLWKIIKDPVSGEFYAPKNYVLTKEVKEINVKSDVKVFSTSDFTVTLLNTCGGFYTVCDNVNYLSLRNKE